MAKRLKDQKYVYPNEFAAALADGLSTSKDQADQTTEAFLKVLEGLWSEGRTVCFPNFGVFEVRIMTEKMGRNPKTMEEYLIPASYKPAFRPTKDLKQKISQAIQEAPKKGTVS